MASYWLRAVIYSACTKEDDVSFWCRVVPKKAQSPNQLLNLRQCSLWARPVLRLTLLWLLDAPPCSARRSRCSVTCLIKAATLPFLSENGINPSTNGLLIVEDPEPALWSPNKLMCANGTH